MRDTHDEMMNRAYDIVDTPADDRNTVILVTAQRTSARNTRIDVVAYSHLYKIPFNSICDKSSDSFILDKFRIKSTLQFSAHSYRA